MFSPPIAKAKLSSLALYLITALIISFLFPLKGIGREVSDAAVKAAYLYNFAKFTDWPPGSLDNALIICVVGKNPFNDDLEKIVSGKTVAGHPIRVEYISSLDQQRRCQVLFVGQSESFNTSDVLKKYGKKSVLSVGEGSGFIDQGGLIQFFLKENNVRFEIHLSAVQEAGLKIDARVLRIATIRK